MASMIAVYAVSDSRLIFDRSSDKQHFKHFPLQTVETTA